ncbi:MAG TPA: hypothetical protein PLV83_04690 [Bacilli bacterium]|nr:hypothetical protein [Bacilli bacterium]
MKYKLVIKENDELNENELVMDSEETNKLYLYINKKNSILNNLMNTEVITKNLKQTLFKFNNEYNFSDEEIKKIIRECNILNEIEEIELDFDHKDSISILRKNDWLYDKKIVVNHVYKITDTDKLSEYSSNIKELYLKLEGNEEPISYADFEITQKPISTIGNKIIDMKLSPLEAVMYIYDIVRKREYKIGDENNYADSRDLTKVIKGENIVCLGYCNVIKSILDYIGYKSNILIMESNTQENIGHARNAIYINDPKYNVRGAYIFDATFDSKKGNNNYLYNYKHFAQTFREMSDKDKGEFKYFENCSSYKEACNISSGFNFEIVEKLNKYIDLYNFMAEIICKNNVIDIDELNKKSLNGAEQMKLANRVGNYLYLFNKHIYGETLIQALYNVRKKEQQDDEKLYSFSIEDILKTAKVSNWTLSQKYYTKEKQLRRAIGIDAEISEENNIKGYVLKKYYKE